MVATVRQPSTPKLVSPLKYLRGAINQIVLVKLKDGTEYVGVLELVDNTMNVVLSDCEEIDPEGKPTAKYGRVLIRGSHILFVSINYGQVAPEIAAR
ncbi:ribonucleoprotein [Desulfurococcaceae archaeon MEX13E-LK6-19]|nr:ribonucleoprotein [Desulfurococcaceae archaeon MEX13E-LK6-19]